MLVLTGDTRKADPKILLRPVVVGEVPVSYTKNFDKKRVDIFFSEFVQLKEVSEKFVFPRL